MKKIKTFKKKQYIDSVEDFYDSLENVFHTPEFKEFFGRYLMNSDDSDVASIYFMLFYIVSIKQGNIFALENVQTLMKDSRSRSKIIDFFTNTFKPIQQINILKY